MLEYTKRFLSAPAPHDKEDKIRAYGTFNAVSISVWALTGVMFFGTIFIYEKKAATAMTALILVAILLISQILARRDRISLASAVLVSGFWCVITVSIWPAGGLNTVVSGGYIALTVMAGMLLGRHAALVVALVSAATSLGFAALPSLGFNLSPYYPMRPLAALLNLMYWLCLAVPAIWLALKGLDDALGAARQEAKDRKESEEALEESEERFRTVADFTYDWEYWMHPEGKLLYVSPSCERVTGYSAREFLDDPSLMERIVHPDDLDDMMNHFHVARKVNQESSYSVDFRIIRRDGQVRWINHACQAVYGKEGQSLGRRASNRDITERKRSEEALRESEARYRLLVENVNDAIYVAQDGLLKSPNYRLTQLTGYELNELAEQPFTKIIHPADADMVLDRHKQRVKGALEHASEYQFRLLRKDGNPLWVELGVTLIEWEGRPATLNVLRDVTERMQAEEDLRKSEEKYRTLFEDSLDALFMVTEDGTLVGANKAYFDLFGYEKDEILGHSVIKTYADPAERPRYHEALVAKGFVKDYPLRLVRKDGRQLDCLLSTRIEQDEAGKILISRGFIRDTTDQKNLQTQLLQAQKMEAVGILAGGVAHDFNNLLTVVQGYSELLLMEMDEKAPGYSDLRKIHEAGLRGAELVRNLLAFSRKADTNPRPINLNDEVARIQKLLSRTIPKMIKTELHLEGDLAAVEADPDQIGQVLMNLAVNSEHAMPEGGKLTIATANITLDEEFCRSYPEMHAGNYAMLTVSDTGHGMDEETLQHIFEPFFTTKGFGKGTGLGLSMVYGIIRQHGGHITCYSEPNHGTTFKIYLPAKKEDVMGREAEGVQVPPRGGTETILLVDDEDFIRDLGQTFLTKAGYTVLTAASGPEAVHLYLREGETISLVILDLIMPEMGGDKCLEEILAINPEAKIVISSGAAVEGKKKETVESGARGFVSKPFQLRDMLKTVRKVLDEG
ncbi:MAG: PAS domain S-box protein [Desulfomonilaceae bacterium]